MALIKDLQWVLIRSAVLLLRLESILKQQLSSLLDFLIVLDIRVLKIHIRASILVK